MRWGGFREHLGATVAATIMLIFVVGYMATGYLTLDPPSRRVPLLAGAVTVALLLVELFRQGTGARRPGHDARVSVALTPRPAVAYRRELKVLASVVSAVAGVYLVGFLAAIPLYIVAAIVLVGERSLRTGAVTAILMTAAIYAIFGLLLSYRLFPGVFFA